MEKNYKAILLTVLTLSAFTIAIVELSGISRNQLFRRFHGGGEGAFYSKDGEIYHGEIFPEQTRTRDQIVAEMPRTTIQFYETKYSFGAIQEGRVVKHAFRFKNTGQYPLMIAKTDVTCGCTVSDYQKEPIPAGSDGEISVEYNSTGKSGFQQKNVIIHSNAIPEAVPVTIEADVK